jgi:hypothetical protein
MPQVIHSAGEIYDVLVDSSRAYGNDSGGNNQPLQASKRLGLKFTPFRGAITSGGVASSREEASTVSIPWPGAEKAAAPANELPAALSNTGNQHRLLRLQHKLMCVALRATSGEGTSAEEVRRQLAPLKAEAAGMVARGFATPIASMSDPTRGRATNPSANQSLHTS